MELKEFEQVLLYTVPCFKFGSFCYATVAGWGSVWKFKYITQPHNQVWVECPLVLTLCGRNIYFQRCMYVLLTVCCMYCLHVLKGARALYWVPFETYISMLLMVSSYVNHSAIRVLWKRKSALFSDWHEAGNVYEGRKTRKRSELFLLLYIVYFCVCDSHMRCT